MSPSTTPPKAGHLLSGLDGIMGGETDDAAIDKLMTVKQLLIKVTPL